MTANTSQPAYPVGTPLGAQNSVISVVVGSIDANGQFLAASASAGLPVAGGGGGGGSSLSDVLLTDSNGVLFVGRDQGGTTGTIFTFYRLDTQAAYTPVGTIKATGISATTLAASAVSAGAYVAGSLVDGADLTQGATTDAVVAAGAAGTESAKLRAISRDIGTVAASYGPVAPTDASGKITTGGTAQVLSALNAARRGYSVQNLSAGDLWINEQGTAAISATTPQSFRLPVNAYYESPVNGAPTEAISIIGATTGQQFAARTW